MLFEKNRVIVAGHRGCGTGTDVPENTLISFERAIRLGVDMLELDLAVTRDQHVIVMHDLTVNRTTDGTGPVRDLTLAEVKTLDAGIRWGEAYRGTRVPTFEEFCALMDNYPHILLNVEIKDRTAETVNKAINILNSHNMVERCVFTCFDADIVKYIHSRYGLPCQGFPGFRMDHFERGVHGTFAHMAAAGISMRDLTQERVQDFEDIGILPWAYTPDDAQAVHYALGCGARLVTVNALAPALRILKGIECE